jgi:hypothetical protein
MWHLKRLWIVSCCRRSWPPTPPIPSKVLRFNDIHGVRYTDYTYLPRFQDCADFTLVQRVVPKTRESSLNCKYYIFNAPHSERHNARQHPKTNYAEEISRNAGLPLFSPASQFYRLVSDPTAGPGVSPVVVNGWIGYLGLGSSIIEVHSSNCRRQDRAMFRSSASLMAEDVTVRCRVRKLPSVDGGAMKPYRLSPKSFGEDIPVIEMTCTMRNWESGEPRKSLRSSFSLSNQDVNVRTMSNSKLFHSDSAIQTTAVEGPELLFIPTFDLSPSKPPRSSSNGPFHSSRRISPMALQPYSIPVEEILQVTMEVSAGGSPSARTVSNGLDSTRKIQVTTISLGCYDIDCLTTNGHDIVLAFLQGALPSERIVRNETANSALRQSHRSRRFLLDHVGERGVPSTDSLESSVHSSSVLDIDTLQAKHLKGRAEAETWYEKLQRRVGHIVSTVSDQWSNGSFCDACCQPNGLSSQNAQPAPDGVASAPSPTTSPYRTSRRIQPYPKNAPWTPTRNGFSKSNIPKPKASSPSRAVANMTKCFYNDLEIDDSVTECSVRPTPTRDDVRRIPPQLPTNQHRSAVPQIMAAKRPIQHMPSGLSVEPDPYDVESVR